MISGNGFKHSTGSGYSRINLGIIVASNLYAGRGVTDYIFQGDGSNFFCNFPFKYYCHFLLLREIKK